MAWTSPMTFTVGSILTAAQLNANLSANLNYLRSNATNLVGTSETYGSTTYGDCATVGPSVTVTTDVQALVTIYGVMSNNVTGGGTYMAFAVSGASTMAAVDSFGIQSYSSTGGFTLRFGSTFLVTGLTAGSNTFTAKYRATNIGTYQDRRITVVPC